MRDFAWFLFYETLQRRRNRARTIWPKWYRFIRISVIDNNWPTSNRYVVFHRRPRKCLKCLKLTRDTRNYAHPSRLFDTHPNTHFLRLKQATHMAAVNAPRNITQPRIIVITSMPDKIVFSLRWVLISFSLLEINAVTLPIGSNADLTSVSRSFNDLQKRTST